MRFTREKLLKNISERQLRNYQKAYGYAAFAYPRKELTINENENHDSKSPTDLWKELFLEETRISTELAAIKRQLATSDG